MTCTWHLADPLRQKHFRGFHDLPESYVALSIECSIQDSQACHAVIALSWCNSLPSYAQNRAGPIAGTIRSHVSSVCFPSFLHASCSLTGIGQSNDDCLRICTNISGPGALPSLSSVILYTDSQLRLVCSFLEQSRAQLAQGRYVLVSNKRWKIIIPRKRPYAILQATNANPSDTGLTAWYNRLTLEP